MKWRHETLPAVPRESTDLATPGLSQFTDADILPGVLPDTDEQLIPEPSIETMSVSGNSNTSTPRPSRKQTFAHVLIVDDNDINLKVCLPGLSMGLYKTPLIVRTKAKTA